MEPTRLESRPRPPTRLHISASRRWPAPRSSTGGCRPICRTNAGEGAEGCSFPQWLSSDQPCAPQCFLGPWDTTRSPSCRHPCGGNASSPLPLSLIEALKINRSQKRRAALAYRRLSNENRSMLLASLHTTLSSSTRKLVFLAPLVLLLIEHAPLRVCLSNSEPAGLYRITTEPIKRGDQAQLCLPASVACLGKERGYLGSGGCPCRTRPVLKRIVAVPGDLVRVRDDSISVNGRRLAGSARRRLDSAGRVLTPRIPPGLYRVAPDSYWALGSNDIRSWDSRYFGAVPACHAVALRPVWVRGPIRAASR